MKKVLNIILKVLSYVAMVVALFAVVFTIFSVSTIDNSERDLFGHKFYVVLSDSMSATDFAAGDMIVVNEVDVNTLNEGDIITFYSTDSKSFGEIITHKIREVVKNEDGVLVGFRTYGTTTNTDDEALVDPTLVQGQYQFAIPKMGYFIQFMKTPVAYVLFVAVPFALIIGHEVYKFIKILVEHSREKRKIEDEQRRIEAEEREKLLAEERSRNEQILKELEELKKRLASSEENPTE